MQDAAVWQFSLNALHAAAWNEMLHRYFASFVVVMIVAIAWQTLRSRRRDNPGPEDPSAQIGLPLAMVGLVMLQGLFGTWTVTLLLAALVMLNFAAYWPSSFR